MNNLSNNVSAVDLSSWGVLSVSGKDTVKFLQGQLTQDMSKLSADTAALSAYLTPKGRVIANFVVVYLTPESILLIMPKVMIGIMLEKLKKYALFSKVTLADVSGDYHVYGVIAANTFDDIKTIPLGDMDLSLVITPSSNTITAETDISAWNLALIKNKIPMITEKNTEIFTVHDLGLDQIGAVNFKKGCYTGQEIVARMHYKAKLKQHLYLLSLNDEVQCNQIFVDSSNNEIGRVVNIAHEQDDYKALVWLRDDALDAVCLVTSDGKEVLFKV